MLQSVKSKESERSADTTEKYRVEIVLRLGTAFVGQIHRQLERAFELTIERRFHPDHSLIFSNDSSDSLGRNCIGVRRLMPPLWNAITRGVVPMPFSHAHHKASGRSIRTDTGLLAQFRFCCVLPCLIVSRASLADRWLLEPAASNSTPIAELLGVPPDTKDTRTKQARTSQGHAYQLNRGFQPKKCAATDDWLPTNHSHSNLTA